MTEKTALRLSIILSFFMIIYTAALFTSCSAEQKKPETLAETIVANISDTTQKWHESADTSTLMFPISIYEDYWYIENKSCNIKLMINNYSNTISMILPDTFAFNLDESEKIYNAFYTNYTQKKQQKYSDSCEAALKIKEKHIINMLCRK